MTAQSISETQAVILAGGLGSRLHPVVSDRPKVLAEVRERPFLSYLLDQISSAGVLKAVICTGYMGGQVREMFGDAYGPLRLRYSREQKPLGTGGALRLALPIFSSDAILVMNGDSYTDVDLGAYVDWFFRKNREISLVLTKVSDTTRYGNVTINGDECITAFAEKGRSSCAGWINAGIYLMKKSLIESVPEGRPYSLERELFPSMVGKKLFGFRNEGRFIDIGTPEAYNLAEDFFCCEEG